MEPPLVEGIIGKGRHGSIIVWKCFHGDIISPHSRSDDRYSHGKEVSARPSMGDDICDSQMCPFTNTISESNRRIVEVIALVSYFVGVRS